MMSGICWPFQSFSLHRCNDNAISTRFKKRMCHKITHDESYCESSTSVSPGKRDYGNQGPWKSVAGEDSSNLVKKRFV